MGTQQLINRVALVTGGASGIGLAIAQKLYQAGSHIAIADLDLGKAEEALTAIPQLDGQQKLALCVDMADYQSVYAMAERCEEKLGRIDILVNNAGFQHVAPIENFPKEVFQKLIDVMLVGPFVATQAVFAGMKQRGWGRIINISSINGKIGAPFKAGYCSAKHGIIGLTRVTAVEAGDSGVTCNAICPGFVDTPLVRKQLTDLSMGYNVSPDSVIEEVILPHVPQNRLIGADEIGDTAVFLSSDEAAAITGQAINVSGGYVMH
ncbi:3-hydroxybutyrate dehydrogenase [Brevibacillus humidisoli]|uniref:3-hydroxybutyrate dehydrogenase n=1 Tax=Brevibacillus humidisoli TaxID=2895522 RepID=UPI001E40B24E|nr:3-hydroxybutyrate dehydrogenase [Brevibacillus humidisoli]UFJ42197.1 3-hydroxybutyrate dehydrogenase [Brevibacillus humidisoli]